MKPSAIAALFATSVAAIALSAPLHAQTCTDWGRKGKLLHADDFRAGLAQWVAEYRAAPGSTVAAGGANDRLSDLNQFWMASDPRNADLFTRDGTFSQYDPLRLYYVGIGGNSNTTTRFRKYDGSGERVLLGDLADQQHLLQPNREYRIEIAVYQGCTRLTVDGEVYFSFRDPDPLRDGHFGFRTTHSRQEVSDFTIHQLTTTGD